MKVPAVSVIIPLYNVEKYVAECLDSILAQTFTDFEVIVVDDCSTDNSVAVVESYVPKFDGRLKLLKMISNSGTAGLPRNKGFEFSRGEYIYFVDPDDTIKATTLHELYSIAKSFDADVVHCEKLYEIPDKFYHDAEYRKTLKPRSWPAGEKVFITKPTLLDRDVEKRATSFSQRWLTWGVWNQLVRRDFIVKNEIKFGNYYSQDMIFTMCEICCAERYVVVPNVVYFYRKREGSAVFKRIDAEYRFHRDVKTIKLGVRHLDEFLSKRDFLAAHPNLKYLFFNMLVSTLAEDLKSFYEKSPALAFDEILRKEFDGSDTALSAFIFNALNIYRLQLGQLRQQNFQLNQTVAQTQSRIAELEAEIHRLTSKE